VIDQVVEKRGFQPGEADDLITAFNAAPHQIDSAPAEHQNSRLWGFGHHGAGVYQRGGDVGVARLCDRAQRGQFLRF